MMRKHLADELHTKIPLEPQLYKAFCAIDRKEFIPEGLAKFAYKLDALPVMSASTVSSPLTVAKMTHALDPYGVDGVLEIGCGSGYQAAILSQLARRVFTVERVEKLLDEARVRFKKLGLMNVNTRLADGQLGWKEFALYDRILFSASTACVPALLFEQLEVGGILVAPIQRESGHQEIVRYTKRMGYIDEKVVDRCNFVPVLDGVTRL
jgi:protein-L-isoaspartate(D-aspartate) O-methyltransferase